MITQSANILRTPSPPKKTQQQTQNKKATNKNEEGNSLKRTSFNHLDKHLATNTMLRPCRPPLKRENHLLMLMTGDAKRKTRSSLAKCKDSQQRTDNITQPTRLAYWKCWIATITHQFGHMPTLMDHCGRAGNQEWDCLAKLGSEQVLLTLKCMEKPKLLSSSVLVRSGCKHVIHHLKTGCITCHAATDNHIPPSSWPSALPSVLPWPFAHTGLPVQNSPTKPSAQPAVLTPVRRSQEPDLTPGSYMLQEKKWRSQEQLENISLYPLHKSLRSFLTGPPKKKKEENP